MSPRRAPQAPPTLAGFTFVDVLGSGGFADVFLYEQQLPRRRVAVKVLLTERMSSGSVAEFTAEANVMAMLSTHPAIVTIYQAGVADDGRPYLVMEYCPRPNLQVRYRREPFSIAESLRVGVQVAGAVETAHRAGVLHRDIKPANILVTEYNRPALTDFGIASSTAAAAESAGLSIPWSPPESFADDPRSDPRSDVYALGATVYTLLAGRSPYELQGQRNSAADLIQRVESSPLPPLGRPDAPVSLQRLLERAMAKAPDARYRSAAEFARALQKVQIELSHAVTPIDILDDGVAEELPDDSGEGLTRVRGVVSIDPATAPAAGATRPTPLTVPAPPPLPSAPPTFLDDDAKTALRPPVTIADVAARSAAAVSPTDVEGATAGAAAAASRSRGLLWTVIGGAALLLVVAVIAVVSLPTLLGAATPTPSASQTSQPVDVLPGVVPAPENLAGAVTADGAVFTWTNPDPEDGDVYLWGVVTRVDNDPDLQRATATTVTVPVDPSGTTCITVILSRANGRASAASTGCTS